MDVRGGNSGGGPGSLGEVESEAQAFRVARRAKDSARVRVVQRLWIMVVPPSQDTGRKARQRGFCSLVI
jgi:hypothetical protein